jgi:hypothetical protein
MSAAIFVLFMSNEELREKPVPLPLYTPKIPHGLTQK